MRSVPVWHSLFCVWGLHEVALVCVIGLHNNALFFRSLGGCDGGSFRASVWVLACSEKYKWAQSQYWFEGYNKMSIFSLLWNVEEFKTLFADKNDNFKTIAKPAC